MRHLKTAATVCVAIAGFIALTAQAEPVVHARRALDTTAAGGVAARSAGSYNGSNIDAAGQRRLRADGQGNVNASASSALSTVNGSTASRTARFSRSADGTASGQRSSTATNADTGVTWNGSTTYTQGSGVSRSGGCTDAAGNTVTCGSAR
jgi:hypothetical protein